MDYSFLAGLILGALFGALLLLQFLELVPYLRRNKKGTYHIAERQIRALKILAEETGHSVEEHIRKAIDDYFSELCKKEAKEYEEWKKQVDDKEDHAN